MVNLFARGEVLGWSANERGLAVFFLRRSDYEKAARGGGSPLQRRIWSRFTRLLECGEADVELTRGGIFIAAEDAVCPATIKTDPRRQLELTPDRVVLRGGRGALRHAV
jgi:hypothetical protein